MINEVMTAMIALPRARRKSTRQDRELNREIQRKLFTGFLVNGYEKDDSVLQYDEYCAEPGQTITESLHIDNTWVDFMRRHIQRYD